MQRRGGIAIAVFVLLLLLMFGSGFGGDKPDGPSDGGDDELGPCPDGMRFTAAWLQARTGLVRQGIRGAQLRERLIALQASGLERCESDAPGPGGDDGDDIGPCPDGMRFTAAWLKARRDLVLQGIRGAALRERLAALQAEGLERCEPEPFGGPTGPKGEPTEPTEPTDFDDPKPADIDSLIKAYAAPESFHQVVEGETWLGKSQMMTRLASSALYRAAIEIGGLSPDAALEWTSSGGRNGPAAQLELAKIVACVPINDARYGTFATGVNDIKGETTGRAIRLAATATPDADRIRNAQPMGRNVPLGSPGSPLALSMQGVDPSFNARPLLWFPGIDLQALWDSDGRTWKVGGKWKNGTSKIHPPPAIYALGVTDYTNSGQELWGCKPWAAEIGA